MLCFGHQFVRLAVLFKPLLSVFRNSLSVPSGESVLTAYVDAPVRVY